MKGNPKNKRHLVHSIRLGQAQYNLKKNKVYDTIVVGIATNKKILEQRIRTRTEQMFSNGIVQETTLLAKKYSWDTEAMKGNMYQVLCRYLKEDLNLEEAKELFITKDKQLAKRQMTWFRKNQHIHWCLQQEALGYIGTRFASE